MNIKRVFKIVSKLAVVLLLLFIILVLFLSIPSVQTKLGNYVTNRLNEDFKTNINVNRVSLQFNGDIELKEIYIEDYRQDTLISISELNTSILSLPNLYKGNLTFGDIDIEGLIFHIKKYKGESDTNLDIFVKKLESDNPRADKKGFLLSSSDVSVYDGVFKITNENKDRAEIFNFSNLNINATNFLINGSDVSARINTLALKDSRGVTIKNMMTNFKYTLTDMTFDDLEIKTEQSVLKGDLKFDYNREDLQFFTDKVNITAAFKDSNVYLDELNTIYNEFGSNQRARFDVELSGTLNNLFARNLIMYSSRRTKVFGNFNFKNLFNKEPNNFYMNGRFNNLSSTYADLTNMLPNVLGAAIPSSFERLGYFTLTGTSEVTASNVKADVTIETELGVIKSNLDISKVKTIDDAKYKGNIVLEAFDMGTFVQLPKIGVVSLNFDVNGKGFLSETVNTEVKGDISSAVYNNYDYKNTKVAGTVRNKIFDGNLVTSDRNLVFNFNGLVDFSEDVRKYDFQAKVDYANLKALNFVKNDSISLFESAVKMNMNGSSLDDAYGTIVFTNTTYKNEYNTYYFERFETSSRFNEGVRYISINSPDIISGSMVGKFQFNDLKKLFENSLGNIYTNYIPNEVGNNQYFDFNFTIYNKILEVFIPEIQVGKNTFIKGTVESDAREFKLLFKSPEIKLAENLVRNIELQVDNENPLFNTYVELDSISTKYYNVSDFRLINATLNDTLFMRSEFTGGKRNKDIYNLNFYHTINEENESVIGFKKSDITIKDNKWFINEAKDQFNKIAFNKALTKFHMDQLKVNHNAEVIQLSGFIQDSTQKDIRLNFKDVDLAKITPDLDSLSLAGNVNGKLDILQKNGSYLPNSTIIIDNFKVNDFLFGSFDASIKGNETLTNYNIDATIKNNTLESFRASGDIDVVGKQTLIDLNIDFNGFSLVPLNPLLYDVLTDIRGTISGDANIRGNLKRPDIDGRLSLNNGGLGIPYLNVDYKFNNNVEVLLKNQTFNFKNLKITDTKYNSVGELSGALSHVNLSDWHLDLNITTPRLLVLDTEESDESLYFGTGFIGGSASLYGPADQLTIDVIGETKNGTVFKIPIKDTESFGDNTYIRFVTKEEKEARQKGEAVTFKEIKGLELDFDLDVTEDAEVEIIIDKNTGHSLRGSGVGGLLVEINTNGKFNMWGDFSVFRGVYNFAYGGLVQKEFIVQPGGTIAWEGEPLDAIINMEAVYKTQANPSPLLDNPINRSIPVELFIKLDGDLTQPDPDFTFDFPNVNSTIKSELQYRLESQDDRQNQALYLLSTGSFSRGLNQLNFSGTIAERLNGIINGIFSSGDSKFNLGLNYEAGQNRPDYRTNDRVGVTLQTQISDRVLINGKVGVPIGGASATETVIAGDVEIDFLLNEEGTLTAKVFNRENSIQNFGEAIGYTQGVGISYNVDFNTFKELIQNLFKTSKSRKKDDVIEEPSNDNDTSSFPDFIDIKTNVKAQK
ncbi:translocation/assembly module TamB domain-containing protein [Aestuariivivens sediminicola]|uniref:translocation/assembly module TamB domain-containing protein n=1 Tax=Aestuariivivens sediminicola TaxID=2913560 RepID=UPI001F58F23A|nr:translocation/assembly module TamB domain-containing protein [Aestuariivivens sediminicola]